MLLCPLVQRLGSRNVYVFYIKGLTRLLSSILVLRYIVAHGSGMFHACFTGIDAPRAVFPRLPAVDASVAHDLHLEICTLFL